MRSFLRPIVVVFIFFILSLISCLLSPTVHASVYYIHSDNLGSTSLVTDSQGKKVSQQAYYPYGNTRSVQGNTVTERQYTGQVSDQNLTSLYYYNARYYNPSIAKFTQADTAGDGLNKYAYVGNNPINATDPTGQMMDPGEGGNCDIFTCSPAELKALNYGLDPTKPYPVDWGHVAQAGLFFVGGVTGGELLTSTIPAWGPVALKLWTILNAVGDVGSMVGCGVVAASGGDPSMCADVVTVAAMGQSGLEGPMTLLSDPFVINTMAKEGLSQDLIADKLAKSPTDWKTAIQSILNSETDLNTAAQLMRQMNLPTFVATSEEEYFQLALKYGGSYPAGDFGTYFPKSNTLSGGPAAFLSPKAINYSAAHELSHYFFDLLFGTSNFSPITNEFGAETIINLFR